LARIRHYLRLRRERPGAIYYNFILIARARRGSYYFITPAAQFNGIYNLTTAQSVDLTASTSSYFILTARAREPASPRALSKSKDHNRSVQGGDLTNLQYKQRL
jgi:hypothetical protein